jgi:hypothetical protein
MDGDSASHVIEVRWRGQVPQGSISVPKKALVLEYRLSQLVGGHRRGNWYAVALVVLIITDRGYSQGLTFPKSWITGSRR